MLRLALVAAALLSSSSCFLLFPYNVDNLCDTLVRAECHFAFACCNASERADGLVSQTYGKYRTEDDCVRENLIEVCGAFNIFVESQRAGRFDMDEELVQQCLQPRIEALNACDAEAVFDPPEDDDACEGGVPGEGKVEDGDLCFESFECATEDAVCKPDEVDDDEVLVSAKGTCEPPPGEGDECPDGFCADGLFCGPNATGDNVCQNKRDDDAPCDFAAQCKSEICELDATFQNVCQAPRANGEACFTDNQCASGNCDLGEGECSGVPTGDDVEVVVDACDGLGADEE